MGWGIEDERGRRKVQLKGSGEVGTSACRGGSDRGSVLFSPYSNIPVHIPPRIYIEVVLAIYI